MPSPSKPKDANEIIVVQILAKPIEDDAPKYKTKNVKAAAATIAVHGAEEEAEE